jgi:UDP-MurNAc hydroxylase
MGFENVRRLRHAQQLTLGPHFHIRPYHFTSSPVTDSALVIAAGDYVLFNANDTKLMGKALDQVLTHYPRIDFAFRSHSSANARVCYTVTDAAGPVFIDDRQRYIESFYAFMKKVRPRFAIPFASNHCYLHRQTFPFNDSVVTPVEVKAAFDLWRQRDHLPTEVRIMVSEDTWTSDAGFVISENDYFTNRGEHLERYQASVTPALEKYYAREQRVSVDLADLKAFFSNFTSIVPWILRLRLRNKSVLFIVTNGSEQKSLFSVNAFAGMVDVVTPEQAASFDMSIEAPAIVLRQALTQNMFGHAAISKRLQYRATLSTLRTLRFFETLLALCEYEVFPMRRLLSFRTLRIYGHRWREIILYAQIAIYLLAGGRSAEVEARFLR